ncbi:MAG: SUMF1/EgtB/PvdO family nonheme iron enzyme [Bacteroidota bacterium]
MLRIQENFSLEIDNCPEFPLEFIWSEPGTFIMGCENENQPSSGLESPFTVKITHGYWLAKFMLTEQQFNFLDIEQKSKESINTNPIPKLNFSWFEAMNLCSWLNKTYFNLLPQSYGFSLPAEIEWEYAAKCGKVNSYSFDWKNLPDDINKWGWFKENSNQVPHPVGTKNANPWGFFDMIGNGFEWCYDAFEEYPEEETVDWIGRKSKDFKTLRSSSYKGSFKDPSFRVTFRTYVPPKTQMGGLRLAISQRPYFD